MTIDINSIESKIAAARSNPHSGIYNGVWSFAPEALDDLVSEVKRLQGPYPRATLTPRQAAILDFIGESIDELGYAQASTRSRVGSATRLSRQFMSTCRIWSAKVSSRGATTNREASRCYTGPFMRGPPHEHQR